MAVLGDFETILIKELYKSCCWGRSNRGWVADDNKEGCMDFDTS